MRTPTIHANGTPADALVGEAGVALDTVRAALRAVQEMTVNGRDYYPQGPNALEEAGKEQRARLVKLQEVEAELEEYYGAISFHGVS